MIGFPRNLAGGGGAFYAREGEVRAWRCCLGEVNINNCFGCHASFKGGILTRDGKQRLFLSSPRMLRLKRIISSRNRFFLLYHGRLGALYYDGEHLLNAQPARLWSGSR